MNGTLSYSHSEFGMKKKQDLPAGASWTGWAQSQGPSGSDWQWFSKVWLGLDLHSAIGLGTLVMDHIIQISGFL